MDWQARYREMDGAHEVIIRAVNDLRSSLRDDAFTKIKMTALYDGVACYCSRQDDAFYKSLKLRHQNNPSALKIIDFFHQDLKSLKVRLVSFEDPVLSSRKQGYQQRMNVLDLLKDVEGRLQTERSQFFALIAPDGSSIAS